MMTRTRYGLFCLVVLFLLTSLGCAQHKSTSDVDSEVQESTQANEDAIDFLSDDFFADDDFVFEPEYYDPLEPMNRVFFEFNDKLYFWFLKPVNTVYTAVLPIDIRYVLGNFVANLATPMRFLNNLLQGEIRDAGTELSRFLINSTLGVLGLGDPALVDFGLEPKPEDFGQTLGVWGVGEGVYLCWPIIGPSNVRDTFGFAVDAYSHPVVYFNNDFMISASYYTGSRVNLLSLNPGVYEDLKKYSLDPYVSMRQVYLDYRRNKIQGKSVKQPVVNEL